MIKRIARTLFPPSEWLKLCHYRTVAHIYTKEFIRTIDSLGFRTALTILMTSWLRWKTGIEKRHKNGIRSIRINGYQDPLYYRIGTSDLDIIRQIFVKRDYECVGNESNVNLIIDCGANIGCASFYFLNRYPQAHVIAIEPDNGNFALCQRNLRPFKDRVTLVRAGVWSSDVPLRVERGNFRDGRECSFQTRPVNEDEQSDFQGVTVGRLLEMVKAPKVDILKVDIEAAEKEVFSRDYQSWLKRIRHLVIELHGEDCERTFYEAMADFQWESQQSGELTVCRNIRSSTTPSCLVPLHQ